MEKKVIIKMSTFGKLGNENCFIYSTKLANRLASLCK